MAIVTIEIETAIRRISWATSQVGQKSMHTIVVDLGAKRITASYRTGVTHMLGVNISSARDSFRIVAPRFPGNEAHFLASGETASGVRVMPNINYDFNFQVTPTEVRIGGSHDGYPSYHVAVNGRSAYDYIQGNITQLLGSSDITVPRTTFII